MGACVGKKKEKGSDDEVEEVEVKENKKQVSNTTKEQEKKNETKVLLLGAGESGKSTVWKQMKIIHAKGFSDEERENLYRPSIVENVVQILQGLIVCAKNNDVEIGEEHQELIESLDESVAVNYNDFEDKFEQLLALWNDEGIQKMAKQSDNGLAIDLADTANYWYKNFDRVLSSDYSPTVKDIIKCRSKTTGIQELRFELNGQMFKLIDVGGQKSERKKWITCFQNLTAIVFVIAMSEYDLKMREDESANRMQDAIKLFKGVVCNDALLNVNLILFLNKMDIFEKKLAKSNLKDYFDEYEGGNNKDEVVEFLVSQFTSLNQNPDRKIYTHPTIATKIDNIREAMDFVKDTIVGESEGT